MYCTCILGRERMGKGEERSRGMFERMGEEEEEGSWLDPVWIAR